MSPSSVSAAIVGALMISAAQATNVFSLEGYGAMSRSMGSTGVALDLGTAALMNNPATLTLATSREDAFRIGMSGEKPEKAFRRVLEGGINVGTAQLYGTNLATGETMKASKDSLLHAAYASAPEFGYLQRWDRVTLAFGGFVQAGLVGTVGNTSFMSRVGDRNDVETGRPTDAKFFVLRFPVGISVDVTDRLSLGASLDPMVSGINFGMSAHRDQLESLASSGRLSGSPGLIATLNLMNAAGFTDGVWVGAHRSGDLNSALFGRGYGGKLGLLYALTPRTNIGLAYRMKSRLSDMEGPGTIVVYHHTPLVEGPIELQGRMRLENLQMPREITVGVAHRVDDRLLFSVDFTRAYWSEVFKDINARFSIEAGTGIGSRFQGDFFGVSLPQNFRDVSILAFGAEFRASDRWSIRGGVSVSNQPLPDGTMLALVPPIVTRHAMAGFAYQVTRKDVVSFAYSHAFEERKRNTRLPNVSPVDGGEISLAEDNAVLSYQRRF